MCDTPVTRAPPSGPALRTRAVLGRPQAPGEQCRFPGPGQNGRSGEVPRGLVTRAIATSALVPRGFTSELHSRQFVSSKCVAERGAETPP